MKTLRFIGMALFAVLMCVNFASCSNDENEVPKTGEEIIVSFGLKGEINVSESPLGRAETAPELETNPDLYGIQIYSCPVSSSTYEPYAYGLFDDVSSLNISLIKGYKYKVSVLLIKDGKTKINLNSVNGRYDYPFDLAVGESFTFSTIKKIDSDSSISLNGGGTYLHAPVEKYYGETTDFIPSDDNNSIDIYMKKMFYAINFIAENLTEGKLSILAGAFKERIEIISPENTFYRLFSIKTPSWAYTSDDSTEKLTLDFIWTKTDGADIPLGNLEIAVKRNKLYTITIKVAHQNSTSGLNFTIENEEMTNGENITFENGEIVDTNIGTETEG